MGTFRRKPIPQWEYFGGYRNENISEDTSITMVTFRRVPQLEHFGEYPNGNISENYAMGTFRRIP
jgi:hypothetical protein